MGVGRFGDKVIWKAFDEWKMGGLVISGVGKFGYEWEYVFFCYEKLEYWGLVMNQVGGLVGRLVDKRQLEKEGLMKSGR